MERRTRGEGGAVGWAGAGGALLAVACAHRPWPERSVKRLGDWGSHTLYLGFIVTAALLLLGRGLGRRADRLVLAWPAAAGLGTFLCVEGLKRATGLPRPDGQPTGFPSGHTTFAFALAWLLARVHPRLTLLWYAVATAVGWSRFEGLAHFPYQILCGAVLGTLLGACITRTLPAADWLGR